MKAILALVFAALVGFAAPTSAQPPAGQIVTILAINNARGAPCPGVEEAAADTIINPDGSLSPLAFPPGKQFLVITSADWTVPTGFPNNHYRFHISFHQGIASVVAGAGAQADQHGWVSGSLVMPTGFVVGPGVTLCVGARGF